MTRDMADAHETARERDAYRTRTHAINPTTGEFTPLPQETPMPTSPSTITVRLDPELVALLTEIRDRLPEPEGVNSNPDLIARNLDAIKHELETPMREHGECCDPGEVTQDQPVTQWKARYKALRAEMDTERGRWASDGLVYRVLSDLLNHDAARTPQADPDTVTLRRDDVIALLKWWTGEWPRFDTEATAQTVRAALGWGDSDDT